MTNTGMVRQVFGNDEPPAILELLEKIYVTPILQELYQALFRLHNPMYSNQDVMLLITEEFQMLLMEHPYGYHKLRDVNLISYYMIKLTKYDSLYTKVIES